MSQPPPHFEPAPVSLVGNAWRQLRRNRLAMICLGVIILYSLVAIWAECGYRYQSVRKLRLATAPAGSATAPAPTFLDRIFPDYSAVEFENRFAKPSLRHLLGTDALGRDVFLQVLQGTRIAFTVGVLTSVIAIPIAVILGALAGYFGRRIDDFIVWLYSVFDSIPSLLFIIATVIVFRGAIQTSSVLKAATTVIDPGLLSVCLGIGLTTWVGLCRLMRGEYIKHRDRQYVLAARALGVSDLTIAFRHILPNVVHLVIISFSLRFPGAILTEVVLSYLGIGVQGQPSWGVLISDAKLRLWQGHWYELGGATVAMFFIVLAFNLFGDALRDALDPKLRTAEGKTA